VWGHVTRNSRRRVAHLDRADGRLPVRRTAIKVSHDSASCWSNAHMDGLHFAMTKFQGGLTVMVVDRLNGSSHVAGKSDTQQSVTTARVTTPNGPDLEWRLASRDGHNGELQINGRDFDLAQGTLFVLEARGNEIEVHQLQHDLTGLACNIPAATAFVNEHRDELDPLTGAAAAPAPDAPAPVP
jgi:hypothetical protein